MKKALIAISQKGSLYAKDQGLLPLHTLWYRSNSYMIWNNFFYSNTQEKFREEETGFGKYIIEISEEVAREILTLWAFQDVEALDLKVSEIVNQQSKITA